ncbi:hypothetical protein [Paracoccus sp. KR1-242]
MTIRILLRVVPLVIAALFALDALVRDGASDRRDEMTRLQTNQLAWVQSGLNCPERQENPRDFACPAASSSTKTGPEH